MAPPGAAGATGATLRHCCNMEGPDFLKVICGLGNMKMQEKVLIEIINLNHIPLEEVSYQSGL